MRFAFPRNRSHWPLRARLTVAVTMVTAVVLAATGVLVYGQFARDLDARTDTELRERAAAVLELSTQVSPSELVGLSGEPLAQVYARDGRLVSSTRLLGHAPLLTQGQVESALRDPLVTDVKPVRGTDDGVRVRAFSIGAGGVAVIAEDLGRREQELARLGLLLAVALPGALLLAAFTGYQVAGAALRPVERIRAQAARIGDSDLSDRLTSPGTGDELDRLSGTLNDLLGRLGGALERERRILSDASHELRTPISVLRTRLDVARRGTPDAAELLAVIDAAAMDARRLSRLADDLLLLARADQGRLPIRPEPIDVQDLLEATAHRHQDALTTAERELLVDVRIPGGAVVLADPDRLAQVLDNLVANALRHGAGTIELTADLTAPAAVAIAVRDHGDGFPEELLPRAFERFAQADRDTDDRGAGLGLAIVSALAQAMDATVSAENDPGGGARLTLRVPAA